MNLEKLQRMLEDTGLWVQLSEKTVGRDGKDFAAVYQVCSAKSEVLHEVVAESTTMACLIECLRREMGARWMAKQGLGDN